MASALTAALLQVSTGTPKPQIVAAVSSMPRLAHALPELMLPTTRAATAADETPDPELAPTF